MEVTFLVALRGRPVVLLHVRVSGVSGRIKRVLARLIRALIT
jgi:hypothetical protein